MRIISGELGGRWIKGGGKRSSLRPTSNRVKETLFDILGERVSGAKVLDLFAGTGNLGLEALSRGARESTFIDSSPSSVKIIRENIDHLGISTRSRVLQGDASILLRRLHRWDERFDLIFADPPYPIGITQKILNQIAYSLPPGGIFILQHHKKVLPEADSECGIRKIRERQFGETVLTFYKKRTAG